MQASANAKKVAPTFIQAVEALDLPKPPAEDAKGKRGGNSKKGKEINILPHHMITSINLSNFHPTISRMAVR